MTEAERRGLRALLILLLVGQALVFARHHWPHLLPDVLRGATRVGAASADTVWTRPAPARVSPDPTARPAASPRVAAVSSPRPPARGEPASHALDINSADAASWCALPGIGAKKAAAILEERRRGGPFRGVEDLTRVRGIGPATVARLRPWLRCDSPVRGATARVR